MGTVWGTLGTSAGGSREKGVSPGQESHCIVVGVSTEQRVPASLAFHGYHNTLTLHSAEQDLQGLHRKPVCRAKPRSCWQPWLLPWKGWGHWEDWDGAPLGVGGKAQLLLAPLPEGINLLWCIQCADVNLEEQTQKETGKILQHYRWAPGQVEDPPQCHGCLQKMNHPETTLSAKTSVWQGPSMPGRGRGRHRRGAQPGAPEPCP